MPDPAAGSWQGSHQPAVAKLEAYLSTLGSQVRPLSNAELKAYKGRQIVQGWRLLIHFNDAERSLDLLLEPTFPYTAPRIALAELPAPLTWPHVEDDGLLCLLDNAAEVAWTKPVEVVQALLGQAVGLIEDCAAGRNQEDFRAEFLSYWQRAVDDKAVEFRSLIAPGPSSRLIRVWRGKSWYLLAEDDAEGLSWLRNHFLEASDKDRVMDEAGLLWLDRPLHPREYPQSAADLQKLARNQTVDGVEVLSRLIAKPSDSCIVLLAADSPHGPCLAGLTIPTPRSPRGYGRTHDSLTHGFRPGKVPAKILLNRYFGAQTLRRSKVARADAAWIHGRGQDDSQSTLRAAKVAVIGCGSVGGPVATRLAEAGVGNLALIDPETLQWANIGRHPLGVREIGRHKAEALASQISVDYPHIVSVQPYLERWQELSVQDPTVLSSCQVIVSAIGKWHAEAALNEWHLASGRRPNVVYGWTEAYACAGHAVAITENSGCFHCGMTEDGQPTLSVINWPDGIPVNQEPACGQTYQPYGPVELSYINATVTELVLDCLVGNVDQRQHRIWIGRRSLRETAGGTLNAVWQNQPVHLNHGGFLDERAWPSSPDCPHCGFV